MIDGETNMAKQILYSFELQPGMKVYEDVVDSSGRLILSKDLILDDETIAKLDFFSISEIAINDEEDDPEDSLPPHSFDYSEKVKSSPEYICFNADYDGVVKVIQNNLDGLMQWRRPLDTDMLINAVFMLIKDCKTTIQIFDVMYNLPTTDEPTYRHSLNVAIISVVLGRWIGLKRPDLEQLALAGILHDIGKLLLPVSLLNKQGKLTDEEFERMTSCQGTIRIDLQVGDNVRIKTGSVENAIGTIEEINAEEHKVKVSIEIFSRKVIEEYDVSEVERL